MTRQTSAEDVGLGVMTMAYGPRSYTRMAKGLARSIRLRNPSIPIAIVSDRDPATLRRWFDVVVPLDATYGPGLAQKLHLDRYSPFDRTLFIDSDFLVFDDLRLIVDQFRGMAGLGVFGFHLPPGEPHYAIDDLPAYLNKLGLSRIVMTNTGLLYFDRTPRGAQAFDMARTIAQDAEALGLRRHPAGFFNDEPIFGSVVELLDLPFASTRVHFGADAATPAIFTLGSFGISGMEQIDVRRGHSRHVLSGHTIEPAAIHFNVQSQQSRVYDRELRRLGFGPWLGRTPVPDLVTAIVWFGRRLSRRVSVEPLLQRVRHALQETALLANGWPYRFDARHPDVTPARLVRSVANHARRPFTFVQVGSNDGRTGDPLHAAVMESDVRGLLIEPVPELFERLKGTYTGKTGLTYVEAAITDEDGGSREFYWMPPVDGDPVWADQLGSFSQDVILSHVDDIPDIAERVTAVSVKCRSLPSLIAEHGLSRVDLLHIDAEGNDLAILDTIDFRASWTPRCILYEQKHLGDDRQRARDLLHRAGYSTVDLGADVFAYRGYKARLTAALRRARGSDGYQG